MAIRKTLLQHRHSRFTLGLLLPAPAGCALRPARETAAAGNCARRRRQQRRLWSENLLQRVARADFFAIGSAARTATDADRADHLIVYNDRQSALLHGQAELIHANDRRYVVEGAIGQHMRGLARQQRCTRLVLGCLLIDVGLAVHAVLMDDLPEGVEDDNCRRAAMLLRVLLTDMRKALRHLRFDGDMVVASGA